MAVNNHRLEKLHREQRQMTILLRYLKPVVLAAAISLVFLFFTCIFLFSGFKAPETGVGRIVAFFFDGVDIRFYVRLSALVYLQLYLFVLMMMPVVNQLACKLGRPDDAFF
ncbi:hypothetical protein [Geoalkalibacter halelectricus]|uniref:hypothetical protein n=1 Tax=Geoalkalibacter halelectricus TaxID=2847045 RepID=UPI003D1D5578